MSEVNQEELKEFWEWCGFERYRYQGNERTLMRWKYPDGSRNYVTPNLDLNNLFKWAVPKLRPEVIRLVPITGIKEVGDYGLRWGCILTPEGWGDNVSVISDSPAQALYEAIQKVREEQ